VARTLEQDDGTVAAALALGEQATIETPGGPVDLSPGDVELTQETTGGWGVATEGGLTVALELELTPELMSEGVAREVVRLVQDARKAAGLHVSDRIELAVQADGGVAEAVTSHADWIAGETLAVSVRVGPMDEPAHVERRDFEGAEVEIALRKA
jgi:isoleucyl-tRNA synthetase